LCILSTTEDAKTRVTIDAQKRTSICFWLFTKCLEQSTPIQKVVFVYLIIGKEKRCLEETQKKRKRLKDTFFL